MGNINQKALCAKFKLQMYLPGFTASHHISPTRMTIVEDLGVAQLMIGLPDEGVSALEGRGIGLLSVQC